MNKLLLFVMLALVGLYFSNCITYRSHCSNFSTNEFPCSMFCADIKAKYELFKSCDLVNFIRGQYPPLYYVTSSVFIILFEKNWTALVIFNNSIYLFMLLLFGYLLGKEIKDKRTGIIAGILVMMYPLTYGGFNDFSLDFPLMGLMVMSVYFLHRSDYFKLRKWSVLFGISCGLGMMTKDPFGAFILGPIAYGLYSAVRYAVNDKNFKPLLNVLLFVIVFCGIIYPYYLKDLRFSNNIVLSRLFTESPGVPWYSYENLKIFTTGLWTSQLTIPFFIIFLLGIYYFLKEADPKIKAVILLWVLIPEIILIFMPHRKAPRYLMPVLPALAMISAFYVRSLLDKKYGKPVFIALIALGIFQCEEITFGSKLDRAQYYQRDFDINYPYNNAKVNASYFEFIKSSVTGAIKSSGLDLNREHTIYVLGVTALNAGVDYDLDTYFWFNDIKVRSVYLDISNLLKGYPDAENRFKGLAGADFIMYKTSGIDLKDPGFLAYVRQNFESGLWNKEFIKQIDWDKIRKDWDLQTMGFDSKIYVCENRPFPGSPDVYKVYLYKNKSLSNSKL